MTRLVAALAVVLALCGAARADQAAALRDADRLLSDGAYAEAETAAAQVLAQSKLDNAEIGQAYRIRGLALFFLHREPEAETELRKYLLVYPDAHLDPALVPPEAVLFFESVRARHAGQILEGKPRPKRKRYAILAVIPPLAQFQNGDTTKGIVIASVGAALLAGNITTYAMLRSSCNPDLTCDRSPGASRALRYANITTGVLLVGLTAYGVVDGLIGYRRDQPALQVGLAPIPGGAFASGWGRF